ncbi:MAG TPA: FtsX-like permease family protein, partial [Actinobacteria bacterium]|nr:FtsX-like permease family protein [Actinomycetota bacterium]
MSAGLALLRLARRTARRHPGRTSFVAVLVALGVGVAAFTAIVVRTMALTPEERVAARFGDADLRISVDPPTGELEAVEEWLAQELAGLDAAIHREAWVGPGLAVDLDPNDPLVADTLLVEGDRPGLGEVLASPGLLRQMGLTVGDELLLRTDAGVVPFEIVGTASRVDSRSFPLLLVAPDTFDRLVALPGHGSGGIVAHVATDDPAGLGARLERAFAARFPAELPSEGAPEAMAEPAGLGYEPREWIAARAEDDVPPPSLVGIAVAALLLVEVGLLAAAAYAVGTRRRLRELGLLVANGATAFQIRRLVLAEAGVVAGLGAAVGLALAVGVAHLADPLIVLLADRTVQGPRVDVGDLLGPAVVGVAATLVAAWLPARTAAALPPLAALRGRMPVGAVPRRLVPVAGAMAAAGVGILLALAPTSLDSGGLVALGAAGVVLTVAGWLLLTAKIVEVGGRIAGRLPTTPRLAVREAARTRTKAAAAMAAMTIVFVGPALWGVVSATDQAARSALAGPPRNPAVATVVGSWPDPFDGPPAVADWEATPDQAEAVAAILPDAVRLDVPVVTVPVEVLVHDGGEELRLLVEGATVAVPTLVDLLGLDARSVGPETPVVVLGSRADVVDAVVVDGDRIGEAPVVAVDHQIAGLPHVLVDPAWVAERDLPTDTRYVFALERPLTGRERARLYALDFVIEVGSSPPLPWWQGMLLTVGAATLVALVVAGAVAALTVAETDREVALLVAVGAPPSIRRRLAGFRSAYLAFGAAVLASILALV